MTFNPNMKVGLIMALMLSLGLLQPLRADGRIIRVGISDRSTAPWTYPDKEGLGQELIRLAVEAQGDKIEVMALPWRRCLDMAKACTLDIPLMASPSKANSEFLEFPMKSGQPDPDKGISAANFSVLCRKDEDVAWDGKTFKGLTSPILYASGQAIVKEKLDALGVSGHDNPNTYPQLAEMVLNKRAQAAVMRETIARTLLNSDPRLQDSLHLLPVPFLIDHSYAPASKTFAKENADYLEKVWARIKKIRGTRAWKQREAKIIDDIIHGRDQ